MPGAELAAAQLAAWEALADNWPWNSDDKHAWCGRCGKSIALLRDRQARLYRYTDEQWRALIVLHLRNFHEDWDPDPVEDV